MLVTSNSRRAALHQISSLHPSTRGQTIRYINLWRQIANNSKHKNPSIGNWLPHDFKFSDTASRCILRYHDVKPRGLPVVDAGVYTDKDKSITVEDAIKTLIKPTNVLLPGDCGDPLAFWTKAWKKYPLPCMSKTNDAEASAPTFNAIVRYSPALLRTTSKKRPKPDAMIILSGHDHPMRYLHLMQSAYDALNNGSAVVFNIRPRYMPQPPKESADELAVTKIESDSDRNYSREVLDWMFVHMPHLRLDVILAAMPEKTQIILQPHSNGYHVQFILGKKAGVKQAKAAKILSSLQKELSLGVMDSYMDLVHDKRRRNGTRPGPDLERKARQLAIQEEADAEALEVSSPRSTHRRLYPYSRGKILATSREVAGSTHDTRDHSTRSPLRMSESMSEDEVPKVMSGREKYGYKQRMAKAKLAGLPLPWQQQLTEDEYLKKKIANQGFVEGDDMIQPEKSDNDASDNDINWEDTKIWFKPETSAPKIDRNQEFASPDADTSLPRLGSRGSGNAEEKPVRTQKNNEKSTTYRNTEEKPLRQQKKSDTKTKSAPQTTDLSQSPNKAEKPNRPLKYQEANKYHKPEIKPTWKAVNLENKPTADDNFRRDEPRLRPREQRGATDKNPISKKITLDNEHTESTYEDLLRLRTSATPTSPEASQPGRSSRPRWVPLAPERRVGHMDKTQRRKERRAEKHARIQGEAQAKARERKEAKALAHAQTVARRRSGGGGGDGSLGEIV